MTRRGRGKKAVEDLESDIKRLDAAVKDSRKSDAETDSKVKQVARESADATKGVGEVSRGLTRIDRAIDGILRNIDAIERFTETEISAATERRLRALEGAVEGGKDLGQNVRTFGPLVGGIITAGQTLGGAVAGSRVQQARNEADLVRREVSFTTFEVLRAVELERRKIAATEAAHKRHARLR